MMVFEYKGLIIGSKVFNDGMSIHLVIKKKILEILGGSTGLRF